MKAKTLEILLNQQKLSEQQAEMVLQAQDNYLKKGEKYKVGDLIVKFGFCSKDEVDEAVKLSGGFFGTEEIIIDIEIIKRIKIFPVGIEGKTFLYASVTPLTDFQKNELMESLLNHNYDIAGMVRVFRHTEEIIEHISQLVIINSLDLNQKVSQLQLDPDNGILVKSIVFEILSEAFLKKSSDIHIEKAKDILNCWIRYRIDGKLINRFSMNIEAISILIARIKMMANLDVSEVRRSQDGRLSFAISGKKIDVRVSSLPRADGESIVLRLLDSNNINTIDKQFEFFPKVRNMLKNLVNIKSKQGGIILVTGPTGSGKSTTLSSLIYAMQRDVLKIVTAEDPVEITIPLVNQTQINDSTGYNYATALRTFMRQDPDVMLIGEIRDNETASEMLKGAETGHLMLSTMHTNDVSDTVSRLINLLPVNQASMGLFTIANRLKMISNQRLIPKLCQCCVPISGIDVEKQLPQLFSELGLNKQDSYKKKSGCHLCGYTGYIGRTLCFETAFFPEDSALKERLENVIVNEKKINNIIKQKGVIYISKFEVLSQLFKNHIIDFETVIHTTDYGMIQTINNNDLEEDIVFNDEEEIEFNYV